MLTLKHLITASICTMAMSSGALAATVPDVNLTPMPNAVSLTGGTVRLPEVLTYSTNLSPADLADLRAYLPSYPLALTPAARMPSSI